MIEWLAAVPLVAFIVYTMGALAGWWSFLGLPASLR